MKRTLCAVIAVLWMMAAPVHAVPPDKPDDDVLPAATCLDPETVFNTFGNMAFQRVGVNYPITAMR